MLLRVGILVGLCLTLSRAAEDVIPCTTDKGGKGECVKLHLCPDGILNVDGTNIIDIRFNPENECEDYLLKCCPIPDDDDDERVVEPQTSPTIVEPVSPTTGTTGLHGLATGPNSGPAPHPTASGTGVPGTTGQSTVPGGLPSTTGDLAAGNLKPPGGTGGGECAGGGSHHGHGCCKGNNVCQRPGSPHDEQVDMVGADLLPAVGGKPASADLTHDSGKPPTVHGGGPLVTGTGLNQIASGGGAPNQKPVGSGTNLAPGGAGTQPEGSGVGKPGVGGAGTQPSGSGVGKPGDQKLPGSGPSSGVGGQGAGGPGTQPSGSGVGKPGDQKLPGPGPNSGVGGQGAGGPGSQTGVGGAGTQPSGSGVGKPGDQKVPGSGPSSGVGGQGAGGPGSQAGVGGAGTQPAGSGVGKPGDQKVPGSGPSSGVGGQGAGGPGSPTGQGAGGPGSQPVVGASGSKPVVGGSSPPSADRNVAGSGPVLASGGSGTQPVGGGSLPAGGGPGPSVGGAGAQPVKGGAGSPGDQKPSGHGPNQGAGGSSPSGHGGHYGGGAGVTKPDRHGQGTTQNPLDPTLVPQKCGLRNADGVGFRITGDKDGESEYGEFPWMVAILKQEKALDQVINVYQCGGSLIHPSVVLTAAHCLQGKKPEDVRIRLGEWDTQTKNEMFDYQDRNVVEIVSHPEFYKGGLFNDVALVFLDQPAQLMETVNTICLPPADFNFDASRCFASGWGKDVFGKQGTYQVILKKIELPVMPRPKCQEALRTTRLGHRFKLHGSFMCAGGEKGRDTCKGDGGSPLVCPIPGSVNHYYQAGMVAWGIGCGEDGVPGVYVNVPLFRGWIDQHLTQRNISHSSFLYA